MIKKIIKRTLIGIVSVIVLITVVISILYFVDKNKRLKELESNSQLAETSAGIIEYKIIGDKGPIILIAHGTPGGYDQCWPIEGYRVLALSRPGYLRTPLEVGKTPAEQARAFSALLENLGIDEVAVYGASGGGPSAISFAALYPEKTSALILLMAVSHSIEPIDQDSPLLQSDFFDWAVFSLMQNDSVLKGVLKNIIPDQNAVQLILEEPKKIEAIKGLLWSIWPISKRSPGLQNDDRQFQSLSLPSSKIKAPTLIIHGSEDKEVPVSHSKKLAEQIQGSKLVIIEGVDHLGIISKGEETDKIFNEFLEEVYTGKTEKEEGGI